MSCFEEDLLKLSGYINENDFSDSKVLITGTTGLIGSICTKAFLRSDRITVYGLARNQKKAEEMFGKDFKKINFIFQDISEAIPDNIECDYIIHTANTTTSKIFMTNPVEVIHSIYCGTKQVLDYGLKHKVKGVVYLSSMEVFGQIKSTDRLTEEQLGYIDIQNIRSCYSEGKRMAELLCKSYAVEYGLPVRIARLAQTFGAGVPDSDNRVFAQFARSAVRGDDIILHTKGLSMGNYCYTADVVRAILLLLKKGNDGEVYTVVNEETTRTIAEMAQLVAKEFSDGKSKVVFDIPEDNIYGFAPDTGIKLSAAKLRDLGWTPEVNLLDMYRRMIDDLC